MAVGRHDHIWRCVGQSDAWERRRIKFGDSNTPWGRRGRRRRRRMKERDYKEEKEKEEEEGEEGGVRGVGVGSSRRTPTLPGGKPSVYRKPHI